MKYQQRATFYFSESQLLALDVVMLKLRTERRFRKAGKSEIMRAALEFLLEQPLNEVEALVKRLGGVANG